VSAYRRLNYRKGRADARRIIVMHVAPEGGRRTMGCFVQSGGLIRGGSVTDPGDEIATRDPAEFWAWAWRSQATLLLCVQPRRDLAIAGTPLGGTVCHRSGTVVDDGRRFMGHYAHKDNKRRRMDVYGIANLHPEGRSAAAMSFDEARRWAGVYVGFVRESGLGPRIYPTPASQSLYGFRLHVGDGDRPCWHEIEDLFEFEIDAKASFPPVRIEPADGFHERLYSVDFTAFYLSILASEPMPRHPCCYLDVSAETVARRMERGELAIVETADGEFLATPQLRRLDVRSLDVRRACLYMPTDSLRSWALRMYDLRLNASTPERAAIAKMLGVVLWGRLSARNFRWEQAEYDPDEWDGSLWGVGPITELDGSQTSYTLEDGRVVKWHQDHRKWLPDRYHAIGVHVLAHARQRMEDLMEGRDVVYAHTDSIWCRGVISEPLQGGLGGFTHKLHRNVEFRRGMRIVDGEVDAASGYAREGVLSYLPLGHDFLGEGEAAYEIG